MYWFILIQSWKTNERIYCKQDSYRWNAIAFFGNAIRYKNDHYSNENNSLFLHSPAKLTPVLKKQLDELGKVSIIVCPNKLHHLYINSYVEKYPKAKLYAAPGLEKKRKDIQFKGTLEDKPDQEWSEEIDQMVFRGCFFMEEVFFFHKETKTLIITDFIQSIHS